MQDLVGCTVIQRHFDHWTQLLVTDAAPFFLPDDVLPSIPTAIPIFPRSSGLNKHLTLPFHDSYTTYNVDSSCQHVVFLTDDALRSIDPHIRERLLYEQWRCGRGQIYDRDLVAEFFPRATSFDQIEAFCIETPAGRKCVLASTLWYALPAERQEQWLRRFIADNVHPYSIIGLEGVELQPLQIRQVTALANTFAFTSGPNCFATTLAAATESVALSQTISMLWLHQDTFLHGLTVRGYTRNDAVNVSSDDLSDGVIIWSDDAGTPRHACWLLGQGIALNKNA
ncbi:MAG: hypothetical protein MUD01_17195 [Chloroflexaceae bacterium]|jgi:hypothetical protein|nr:hypothetical protein [Chloroflexaceae bacterium]